MPEPQTIDVNQVFAYRLRDARRSKGWNQERLAEAMGAIGWSIPRSTVAKIEAGRRGVGGDYGREGRKEGQVLPRPVRLDEAVAFAVALGVPLLSLIVPLTREDELRLAPKVSIDVEKAFAWARGEMSLSDAPADRAFYRFESHQQQLGLGLAGVENLRVEDLRDFGIDVTIGKKKKRSAAQPKKED